MEPFEESGLRFTPPTQVCFRFSDGPTCKRLCGRAVSRQLRGELPEACRKKQKLRFYFVLKVGADGLTREALNPMKDKLENDIKAYAELLGFGAVVVLLLDHDTAIERKLPLAMA